MLFSLRSILHLLNRKKFGLQYIVSKMYCFRTVFNETLANEGNGCDSNTDVDSVAECDLGTRRTPACSTVDGQNTFYANFNYGNFTVRPVVFCQAGADRFGKYSLFFILQWRIYIVKFRTRLHPRSNFLRVQAVFRNFAQIIGWRTVWGWHPSGKSRIRPCSNSICFLLCFSIFVQIKKVVHDCVS